METKIVSMSTRIFKEQQFPNDSRCTLHVSNGASSSSHAQRIRHGGKETETRLEKSTLI